MSVINPHVAFTYFMKKPGSSSLSAHLSLKKSESSGLDDERLSSYLEVINFFFPTYVTGDHISHTVKHLKRYKQDRR